MAVKEIELVIPPRNPHFVGDGFRVQNFIPSAYGLDMQRMSPFIMLDYNAPFHFPATDTPRGVGVHPPLCYRGTRVGQFQEQADVFRWPFGFARSRQG